MKKEVAIEVSKEQWKEAQDKAFAKLNKKAKIDGFRPGKAPRKMYEKKYGVSDILNEAMEDILDKKYLEIITKENIKPLLQPKLDITKIDEDEFVAKIVFIVDSEVKLGDYKNLGVKKEKAKATKEEIDHEIYHILDKYAEVSIKDSDILEDKDIAIIDFEGFKDGVAFDGGKGENYSLEIGSHTFIPGFEEQLIGMKKGEGKEIKVTFPEDYMVADLKNQEVVFKVKLHEIKQRVVPEMNKEFFEDLAMEGINSKEDLEKMVKEEILAQKEADIENKYIDDLLAKASSNMEVEIDDELVDSEVDRMYHNFLDHMAMQGITEELYLQYANVKKEDILKDMRPEALNRIKYRYLLEEIAKVEKFEVTDKEASKEAKDMASKYNMTEEELLKEFGGLEMMKYDLKMKKAIECLKENNK